MNVRRRCFVYGVNVCGSSTIISEYRNEQTAVYQVNKHRTETIHTVVNSPDVFVSLQELLKLYTNLSYVERLLRKYGSAIAYARKALNIDPENAKAYFFKAKVDACTYRTCTYRTSSLSALYCFSLGFCDIWLCKFISVNVIMRNFIALYCSCRLRQAGGVRILHFSGTDFAGRGY